ncbi:hypothetical protein IEQ34_022012 [Dendrobium chrysotoxum]|uniref:Uncharacterized protein n=1 Tax=Dendrobium chrysotoxum TaxID=161865 RepID=A0AAV7FWG2_DENCH|nr:hypothetical protein IEQ34_022012 [Dendrobium chrysotoxum]
MLIPFHPNVIRGDVNSKQNRCRQCLCTLASDTTSKLNVLGHDGNAPRVDGAEISILKKPDEIRLRGFLKSEHGMALKSQIGLVILGKLTHQPLKRQFADQEFRGLLVLANLSTNPFESRSELVQERFLTYVKQNHYIYRRATVPGR